MKIKTVLLIALIVLAISCKSEENKTNEETRMERVISVHDEMMPKMGTIGKLISALEQKADSTASTAGEPYKFAQDDLEDAYTYMMDWMKGFGDRFDSDEIMNGKALSKQKGAWLIEEEEKVTIMRDMINNSITNAEALLKDKNED
jgi:hypothetical protein